jgi:hypothetical protein
LERLVLVGIPGHMVRALFLLMEMLGEMLYVELLFPAFVICCIELNGKDFAP